MSFDFSDLVRDRQTDRQTDRQAGRQTDRQAGRQAGRQTDRYGEKGKVRNFQEPFLESIYIFTFSLLNL